AVYVVFKTVRVTGCSELLESCALRNGDNSVAMVVRQFFGANDGFRIELDFNVSLALNIVGGLIVRAVFAANRSNGILVCLAIYRDIDVLKDVLVVFVSETLLRMDDELRP